MIALYFPEFSLKLIKRAEALVLITFSQIDNPARLWLPPDNPHGDAVVVFKLSVDFAHSSFTLR
jgi:hypothetical protein